MNKPKEMKLTLNMLNCFKDHNRYIYILNLGFVLTHVDEIILKQQYMLSVLHSQYYGHDDYQVETFSVLLALCAGNSPVTSEFPHKGQ